MDWLTPQSEARYSPLVLWVVRAVGDADSIMWWPDDQMRIDRD